jgi:beta-lactamase class C
MPPLAAFDADVEAAMQTFQMPGAAVALVQDNRTVYARGFGVRDPQTNAPVSPHTRFRIASNAKSMTSLLAATFVDQGVLDWDAPVSSAWSEFLVPTPALTQRLRLRDLLGMGSGVAESPTIEFFMSAGTESALDQLRSIAYLPVIAPPDTKS